MMMTTTMMIMMFMMTYQVHGAGMATHTMVGVRTAHYYGKSFKNANADFYNDILSRHTIEVISGSDFPDFLYLYNDTIVMRWQRKHIGHHGKLLLRNISGVWRIFADPSEDEQLIKLLFRRVHPLCRRQDVGRIIKSARTRTRFHFSYWSV